MCDPFKKKIYDKVGRLLQKERFSQMLILEKVSEETDIPMDKIERIESGKIPRWDIAMKLANYYGKVIKFTLTDGVPDESLRKQEEEKADKS